MVTLFIPQITQEVPYGPIIPSYPIFGSSYNSQVSHVDAVNIFYIQNYQHSDKLQELLNELFEFYSKNGKFSLQICLSALETINF